MACEGGPTARLWWGTVPAARSSRIPGWRKLAAHQLAAAVPLVTVPKRNKHEGKQHALTHSTLLHGVYVQG